MGQLHPVELRERGICIKAAGQPGARYADRRQGLDAWPDCRASLAAARLGPAPWRPTGPRPVPPDRCRIRARSPRHSATAAFRRAFDSTARNAERDQRHAAERGKPIPTQPAQATSSANNRTIPISAFSNRPQTRHRGQRSNSHGDDQCVDDVVGRGDAAVPAEHQRQQHQDHARPIIAIIVHGMLMPPASMSLTIARGERSKSSAMRASSVSPVKTPAATAFLPCDVGAGIDRWRPVRPANRGFARPSRRQRRIGANHDWLDHDKKRLRSPPAARS